MKNKPSLFIEMLWIIIGIASISLSIKEFIASDRKQALIFLGMATVSFLMAWLRDRQRKNS